MFEVVAFNMAILFCVSNRLRTDDVAGFIVNISQLAVRVSETMASVILLAGKEMVELTVRLSTLAVVALSMVTLVSFNIVKPEILALPLTSNLTSSVEVTEAPITTA